VASDAPNVEAREIAIGVAMAAAAEMDAYTPAAMVAHTGVAAMAACMRATESWHLRISTAKGRHHQSGERLRILRLHIFTGRRLRILRPTAHLHMGTGDIRRQGRHPQAGCQEDPRRR